MDKRVFLNYVSYRKVKVETRACNRVKLEVFIQEIIF